MKGKVALLIILAFNLTFMVSGNRFNEISNESTDKSSENYDNKDVDDFVNDAINFAISALEKGESWVQIEDSIKNIKSALFNFDKGDFKITTQKLASLTILTAEAKLKDKKKMVEVKLSLPKFSEFAYFSDMESTGGTQIWWYNTDTLWGPFHTNDNLNCAYKPCFLGKSTTYGGDLNVLDNRNFDRHSPHIAGRLEKKTIDFPTDGVSGLERMATANGAVIKNHDQVYIEFAGDSIRYKYSSKDPYTTVKADVFSPNHTIFAKDAELHIEGVVSKSWSIGCSGTGAKTVKVSSDAGRQRHTSYITYNLGNVYLDDDLVYQDNIDFFDKSDPSIDLLGIIAKQDVLISDNDKTKNINIDAAIFCEKGGFGAENYAKRSSDGRINLHGGITQKIRKPVGTFSGSNVLSGFNKSYRYDARLERLSPPSYPDTKKFVVVSWLDTTIPD